MKKKKAFIIASITIIFFIVFLLIISKDKYSIKVEKIDSFSPDRRLVVYHNNKKMDYLELQYLDGTYLCSEENPIVSFGEIIEEEKLLIKIDEKRQVIAKIVEK